MNASNNDHWVSFTCRHWFCALLVRICALFDASVLSWSASVPYRILTHLVRTRLF